MYLFKRSLSCGRENGLEGLSETAGGQERKMGHIRVVAVGGGVGDRAECG